MTRDELIHKSVTAALSLAAETPWGNLTLKQIADEADVALAEFHGIADKVSLSSVVEAHFDKAMSEGSFSNDETPRTRLFDVIMMRFEAMEDTREGTLSYLKWRDRSFSGLANRLQGRAASARWALSCCGLDGGKGVPLPLQVAGLSWAIAQAERAWKQETSPDLTRTMAALDSELITLEERAEWLKGRRRVKPKATDNTPAKSP